MLKFLRVHDIQRSNFLTLINIVDISTVRPTDSSETSSATITLRSGNYVRTVEEFRTVAACIPTT